MFYSRTVFVFVFFGIGTLTFCQTHSSAQKNCQDTPALLGRVGDYAGILADKEKEILGNISAHLESDVGSQVAILTITTLNGVSIEDYALRVANCWGLGRKDYNDGLLILVALNDRKMRIEVGYGLEKIITDEIAKDIIVTEMAPHFVAGNYFRGLRLATERIDRLIRANKTLIGQQ